MSDHKARFKDIEWESPIPGMRQKVFVRGSKRIRLVEYTPEMEPHWCSKGHFGYILEGDFELEFDDGIEIFRKGDGVFIPDGDGHRHKAKVLSDLVKAIFVEDIRVT